MTTPRRLDVGFATFGEEIITPRGTTLGVDPETVPEIREQASGIIQIRGIAENLPFRSNSLDRVTSNSTIGEFADLDESILEVIRVLRFGGTARIITLDAEPTEVRELLRDQPVTNVRVRTEHIDPEEPQLVQSIITFRKT